MRNEKKRSILWSAAGLLLSLLALLTVFGGLAGRVLVENPDGIPKTADALMTCIRDGDWQTLKLLVSGNPDLEPVTGEEASAEKLIWDAYRQSLQWSCEDGYCVQEGHVVQCVSVTCLDIPTLTTQMAKILPRPADGAAASQFLRTAAEQALASDAPTVHREISLTLIHENGRWKVVPDSTLLALLSGFTAS